MSETTAAPARPRRWRLRRILAMLLAGVVVLAVVLQVGTRMMEIPSPLTLVRYLLTDTSRQGDLFAAHEVAASDNPRTLTAGTADLPADVPWKGDRISLDQFLEKTNTQAFVVLQDGELVEEWYAPDVTDSSRLSSWSVAKSVVSLLIGQSIASGAFSEDDRLVDLVSRLESGNEYDDITVRHLLDMTAGVDVSENYNPWWPFTGTARMMLTTDMEGFLADHRRVSFTPGSQGEYLSVNTQLLGEILTEIEGKPLAELLHERLWEPMGAENSATWNLDHEGGEEKGFCCVNATARDYARLGQLVLDGGKVEERQVVPAAWVERLATPAEHRVGEWEYSAQWWHPSGGLTPDFTANGVYGQYVYVNPDTRTVVVKLSDHGTEQDEAESIDVFRTLAGVDPTQD